jgi:HAE1 family hydrophobic/amphiphilic exporter-1
VIGGLTFSTILTLLFVPSVYTIFAFNGLRRKRKQHHNKLSKKTSTTEQS